MKFREEKQSQIIYVGSLCPNEYWQQFEKKEDKKY